MYISPAVSHLYECNAQHAHLSWHTVVMSKKCEFIRQNYLLTSFLPLFFFKIVTKSRINLYTLNCQTGPYQPKCKIVFKKNSPKRTLLEGLCKFKAKDMRRRRRKRRIGTDSSLDLTPSTKLYIPSNIKNMCFCCLWADWAVRAVMKISTLLLKYLYF